MMVYTAGPKVQIIYTTSLEFSRNDWYHHFDIYMSAMDAAEDIMRIDDDVEMLLWRLANVNGNTR